ncbi:hypothetical protein AAC387_Pa05g2387 [Persea americana]
MAPSPLIFSSIFSLLILLFSSITMVGSRANKTELINRFLDAHNSARKAFGVPPLKWEPLLATPPSLVSTQTSDDMTASWSTQPPWPWREHLYRARAAVEHQGCGGCMGGGEAILRLF